MSPPFFAVDHGPSEVHTRRLYSQCTTTLASRSVLSNTIKSSSTLQEQYLDGMAEWIDLLEVVGSILVLVKL